MSKKERYPITSAIRALRAASIDYSPHLYTYEERGGTAASSRELGVPEHAVIKTLMMEDESGEGLIVLMHGDLEVSTGVLARALGCKRITPSAIARAERSSGYQVGGISPFGQRTSLPVYGEETIRALERLWINGGKRGFLVSMTPQELERALSLQWVCATAQAEP